MLVYTMLLQALIVREGLRTAWAGVGVRITTVDSHVNIVASLALKVLSAQFTYIHLLPHHLLSTKLITLVQAFVFLQAVFVGQLCLADVTSVRIGVFVLDVLFESLMVGEFNPTLEAVR